MKLLLVEDSVGMRKLMVSMLRGLGYSDITEAVDGRDAWEKMRRAPPDLLLTDWIMPEMDGIALVEKVRSESTYDELPILMFTARSAKEDVIRALQAGVDTYVAKPFNPRQLRAKIDSVVGKRSQRRVRLLLANQDGLQRDADHPLVIFGEIATTARQLKTPDNRPVLDFVTQCAIGLERVSARSGMRLGYLLEGSTSSVTARIRAFGDRIRMVVLASELPGGGVTLARLISINRRTAVAVFVVCHVQSEIPARQRFGLEHLGVVVFERSRVRAEAMEDLLNEFVLAPARAGVPSTLPSPDEIRQRLENDIRSTVTLPVLPQVYHDITVLDRQPESDLRQWIDAIEVDPLARAQVVRRARSPIYGFQGEITETDKAVILLGKNTVKEIVVAGAVRRSFAEIKEHGFDIEDYWLHSVAVAAIARLLGFPLEESAWTPDQRAEFAELELPDDVLQELRRRALWSRFALRGDQDPFVAGMMHDIGKVALIQSYPGLFPMIIDQLTAREWRTPMLAAEQEVAGGADHTMVGRILASSWKLGDQLVQVVEQHHAPGQHAFSQLIAIANFLGGGLYPFPRAARYPTCQLLGGPSAAPAAPPADASPPAAPVPSPREAAQAFLPPNLLEALELTLDELIELGQVLAPTVRRRTEAMRKAQ